jgi:hypothetical protein
MPSLMLAACLARRDMQNILQNASKGVDKATGQFYLESSDINRRLPGQRGCVVAHCINTRFNRCASVVVKTVMVSGHVWVRVIW